MHLWISALPFHFASVFGVNFLSSCHPKVPPQSSATCPPSPERQTMEDVPASARPMRVIECSQFSPKSYKYSIYFFLYLSFSKTSCNVHCLLFSGIVPS